MTFRVVVTGAGGAFADVIAAGLAERGLVVTTRDDAQPVDAVVHLCTDAAALVPAPFDSLDDDAWDTRCEAVLRAALDTCRWTHDRLHGRSGRLVFVTPSMSLVGAAGHAPYTAALEGVRALAKSAARQWAADGITVNCVAPGTEPDPAMAGPIAFLLSGDAAGVTGTTIVVDGGIVMQP